MTLVYVALVAVSGLFYLGLGLKDLLWIIQ